MRRILIVLAGSAIAAGMIGLGIAVAGLASTASSNATQASTSETTSETTTEISHTTKFRAGLTAGAEVPRPTGVKPGAGGAFTIKLTESGGSYSIAWTLTYTNLTGRAQAAHIHRGKPGKAGPVIVSLCGPCTSGRKGKTSIAKSVSAAIVNGGAYVNVHTARNAAGELRGQLKKVG